MALRLRLLADDHDLFSKESSSQRDHSMITQAAYSYVVSSQNQATDESLVLACRQGEAEAWEALINRYQRLIYTIPRRAGLDEDQAAEVFQRTFARLLENLNHIRQPDCIHAWLVTTARRETLQIIRQRNTESLLSYTDNNDNRLHDESIPDHNPLPNEMLERLEEQDLIRAAIASMDERSRDLLTLLYYHPQPLSYAEIAALLDIPEGSVGPTRARCLDKLRRLLEQVGF
jgi:RNA polymerase sigma factor (sigma-70 family)